MNTIKTNKLIVDSNIRQGNKMRTTEYRQLKNSIKAIGMQTPITVYKNGGSEYVVLDGHQRLSIAQELNIVEVPYYETMADQVSVQQLSANSFNIPMTPLEASDVIAALMEENPDYTRKNLANLFGRKVDWVDNAVMLTNLIPQIKKIKDADIGDLLCIAEAPRQIQLRAYNTCDKPITDWDIREIESICRPYSSYNNRNIHKLTEIIPLAVLRNAEEKAGVRSEYSNNLFQEYDNEYYCDDEEFLYDLFMTETEVGRDIFKDIPLKTEDTKGYQHTLSFDMWRSKAKFYREFSWSTDHKYSTVNIVAWDGDPFAPVVIYELKNAPEKATPTVSVQQEKEQASVERQIKKLCRIFKPHLVSYMKDHLVLLESKDDKNIALFWLLKNGHGSELSMSTYGFGDTIAEARDYVKDANTTTEVLFNEKIHMWFGERFDMNSFDEIGILLKEMNLHTLKEIFENLYVESKEFRNQAFDCWTNATLKTLVNETEDVGGKKSDYVAYLAERFDGKCDDKKFPLIDDFIDNLPSFNIRELG